MQAGAAPEITATAGTKMPSEAKDVVQPAAGQCQEEDGDGFSDISDSEFLAAQEDAGRDSRDAVCERSAQLCEGDHTADKIDDYAGATADLHHGEIKKDPGRRKRKSVPATPLEKYRMKYLCVTDLCSQTWCEQQMVYGFERPELEPEEKKPVMQAGASIHLARELEVHDVVSVKTDTREDSWAIKLLNVLSMIPVLQSGGRVREFQVFGEIEGVFLVGVIDELGYTPKGELELRELKTRANPSLPGHVQQKSHMLQVSVYKLLFDGMVRGQLRMDLFISHLHLRLDQTLGTHVKEFAIKAGLTVSTFKDLLELTCLNLEFSNLPMIDSLKLEYCYQGDSTSLGCELVNFDEQNITDLLTFYLSYWKGQRELQGVDIEEAWKCRSCSFTDICEWRATKAREAAQRNQTNRVVFLMGITCVLGFWKKLMFELLPGIFICYALVFLHPPQARGLFCS
ncbi:exonuclease V [Discoglossus pictus]